MKKWLGLVKCFVVGLLIILGAVSIIATGGGDGDGGGKNEISYTPASLTEQNLVNGAKATSGATQVSGLSRSIFNDSMDLQRKLARSLFKKEPIDVERSKILMKSLYSYGYKPEIYGSFIENPQIHETDTFFSMSGDLWADYSPDDEIAGGKMKLNISIAVSLVNDDTANLSFTIKVYYYDFYYNDQHWLYEEGSKVNGSLVMTFNDNLTEDEIEGDFDDYMETCVFNLKGSISYTLNDETHISILKNETIGYDDLYNEILRINGEDTVIYNNLGIIYDLEDIIIGIYDDMPDSGKMIAHSGDKTKTITFINDSFQIDGQNIELDFTPHGTFFESYINVAGTWEGTWESSVYDASGTFTATIIQQDSTLSGSIEVPEIGMYEAELKGTVTGETIVFGDIDDQITFSGTAIEDAMASGTYIYPYLDDHGTWQGTKI